MSQVLQPAPPALNEEIDLQPTIEEPAAVLTGRVNGLERALRAVPGSRGDISLHPERWPEVAGYEILSVLGRGGMGVVFLAQQTHLKREVALKMLPSRFQEASENFHRFRAEAEAIALAQHPNIVQIYEVGEMGGRPFLALEYVDGGSLAKRLQSGPVPPIQAARWIQKLAQAIHFAHLRGIIHRDLKPANVLLTRDGEPKIADFGLARQLSSDRDASGRFLTQVGMVVGTPEYMAPEQVAGSGPSPAVDTYALGVLLYELLTARVPFRAATPVETMTLVGKQEPVSPRRLQPNLPRDLETICLKCLEKDPARRYASALDLAEDLQRFLDDRPIQARCVGSIERVRRWCKRNPHPAASLAGIVCTFLIAFVSVSLSYWGAEAARQDEADQRHEAQRRTRAERWERYRANIVAASSAFQVYNVASARRSLDASPEEYRNWEWRHFHSRLDLAQQVLDCPQAPHAHGALAFDGRRLVAYGYDLRFRVWDTIDGREIDCFRLDHNPPGAIVVSPDGRMVAQDLKPCGLLLLDLRDRKNSRVLPQQGNLQALLFQAVSSRLVSISDEGTAVVWNTETGEPAASITLGYPDPHTLALSPDGRRLAAARTRSTVIDLWDLQTGERLSTLPPHERQLLSVIFDPSGERLLSAEAFPQNTLRLWEVKTGRLIREMRAHRNQVTALGFSPDGSRLATGSFDQTVMLWDGLTGQLIATLRGHRGWVSSLAFSKDGRRLVTSSQDQTIRLWDATIGDALGVLHGHTDEVGKVAFSADGRTIASASKDGTVRLWDTETVEANGTLRGHTTYVYSVAFHPDNERLASASWDGTARIWEARTGRQLAALAHGDKTIVTSVAFHPAGKLLASRARDAVRLWDLATSRELHRWSVPTDSWHDTRLVFSRRGDRLASGCAGREIRIWDVASRAELMVLRDHLNEVRDLDFSPDGRWLASVADHGDHAIRIWDLEQQQLMHRLEGHTVHAYAVAFNHDGTLLASGSLDGTARLWDTATWNEVAVLKHGFHVYGVAFSPDGTRLACACADNSIRLWDTRTFQEVAELRGHVDYVHQVAFSPDGARLASASGDSTARLWDTLRHQDRVLARPEVSLAGNPGTPTLGSGK
jgi:WD40 repeat protein/serine/threonine protein kinase